MTSVGMILMDCYCGAELYYVGDNSEGRSPEKIIGQLKNQLGSANIGFFSSVNGEYGECPYCGLVYELPNSELMNWLPFMDTENFSSALTEMQRTGGRQPGHLSGVTLTGRYLS
jgi:hypothetical protein